MYKLVKYGDLFVKLYLAGLEAFIANIIHQVYGQKKSGKCLGMSHVLFGHALSTREIVTHQLELLYNLPLSPPLIKLLRSRRYLLLQWLLAFSYVHQSHCICPKFIFELRMVAVCEMRHIAVDTRGLDFSSASS